jgi:hypothetical protein
MNTIAPTPDRDIYATEAAPQLRRHHWQNLAGVVCSFRPDWPIADVLDALWASRDRQDFPELARLALAAALDPRCKTAGSIRLATQGLIRL